jgi:acyl carrier protein
LGGHSLLATQLISKVHNQFEIDIPMKILFQATTVADVSEVVQAIKVQNKESLFDTSLTDVEFEETSI